MLNRKMKLPLIQVYRKIQAFVMNAIAITNPHHQRPLSFGFSVPAMKSNQIRMNGESGTADRKSLFLTPDDSDRGSLFRSFQDTLLSAGKSGTVEERPDIMLWFFV